MAQTDFGTAVKKALVDKHMTQRALAASLGINREYLSHIVTGRKPGKKYRAAIIIALELEGFDQEDISSARRAS